MEDLIKALQIFLKYTDATYPTHCEHDVMYINVDHTKVSKEDTIELEKLGFDLAGEDSDVEGFYSFRFGSC